MKANTINHWTVFRWAFIICSLLWFLIPYRWPPVLLGGTGVRIASSMPAVLELVAHAFIEMRFEVVLLSWIILPCLLTPVAAMLVVLSKKISVIVLLLATSCVVLQFATSVWKISEVARTPAFKRLASSPHLDANYWLMCIMMQIPFIICAFFIFGACYRIARLGSAGIRT